MPIVQLGGAPPVTVEDPVCHMRVDPKTARFEHQHQNKSYYFCCQGCRDKFRGDPAKYLAPAPAPPASPAPAKPGVPYTCPMHPEVRQMWPGACPKCGMALEPVEVTATEEPNPELADMSRRFWISLALTVPVLALSMLGPMSNRASVWAQLALTTPVVLWGGRRFFERGWASILSRSPNMFTLIAIGTATAYVYSLAAAFVLGAFVYFETAAAITVLVLLGQVL